MPGVSRLLRALLARLAPEGTGRRRMVRQARGLSAILATEGAGAALRRLRDHGRRGAQQPTPEDEQYRRWLARHEPTRVQLEEMRRQSQLWAYRPLISVVVPVYNPARDWLDAMVSSVRAQTYDNWELCLADDNSSAPHVRPTLSAWAAADARIRLMFRERNGNIAAASNTALALATGDFVALVDHDDILRPHALHAVVAVLQDDNEADLVYSDEDKILLGGLRGQVHFKGEFDPDYLLSTNYISHLSVLRRDAVTAVGGFRAGFDGSQDHDLVLRVSEQARSVRHVADVLYSWRQVPGSAALEHSEKPEASDAGRRAVGDAVGRQAPGARAEPGPLPGLYNARYPIRRGLRVTAVVHTTGDRATATAIASLRRAPGLLPQRWIVIGRDEAVHGLRDSLTDVVLLDGDGNQARLIDDLVADDDSDVLVFLAGGVAVRNGSSAWLEPLVEQVIRPSVGAVGGRIFSADGRPECDGLRLCGPTGVESAGLRLPVIQRVSAVSGDCMAVERPDFIAVGGFDDRYRAGMHDIDLCLRLRRANLAQVFTPLTEVQRLAPSRRDGRFAEADVALLRSTWAATPQWTDPYVSRWLERLDPFVIRDS
jgi:GT2 family glycosyltransferase